MVQKERVATTLRLPKKKLQLLKAIASLQNRKVNDILNELIDQYLSQHKDLIEALEKKNKRKNLKELWKKIKKNPLELEDWKSLEGSFYDEMSSGY